MEEQLELLPVEHEGHLKERQEHNPMEKAFADQWKAENELHDILQGLFRDGYDHVLSINARDAFVVATVIQWLGTNVGRGFLWSALQRVGYVVVSEKTWADYRPRTARTELQRLLKEVSNELADGNTDESVCL